MEFIPMELFFFGASCSSCTFCQLFWSHYL